MAVDRDSGAPSPDGVIEVEQSDAPPPIPPSEMPQEELVRIVDEGNIAAIETALREQNIRLPAVLDEVQRVLGLGHGNLAAALLGMLIASFHISRADRLAEQVLVHADSAGSDQLVELAGALLGQERLSIATKVLDAVLAREHDHGRALYLRARILARRGRIGDAFDAISRVSPKLLGPEGMVIQARYALLAGRGGAAVEGALKHAKKIDDPDVQELVREVERVRDRLAAAAPEIAGAVFKDLRASMAIEYGSLLVELAVDASDGGRFGMDPITVRDAGRAIDRMIAAIRAAGLTISEVLFANEDAEIVAAAVARRTGVPVQQWRGDRKPPDGAWLCMASAATHPHLPNTIVHTLQEALDEGTLRTLALILPCGWRGPLVPDVVGRITGDDELPWAIDDEVEETVDRIFEEDEPTIGIARNDDAEQLAHAARARPLLRAAQVLPRVRHVPFFDETPVPRGV